MYISRNLHVRIERHICNRESSRNVIRANTFFRRLSSPGLHSKGKKKTFGEPSAVLQKSRKKKKHHPNTRQLRKIYNDLDVVGFSNTKKKSIRYDILQTRSTQRQIFRLFNSIDDKFSCIMFDWLNFFITHQLV